MGTPRVISLATAVPETRHTQQEIYEQFMSLHPDGALRDRPVRHIYDRIGIDTRHTVVDCTYYFEERTTQERNELYLAEAVPLAERAIRRSLEQAGVDAQDVEDLIVISCTGIDVPGLDLRLAGRLGLNSGLRRTSVLGMGCCAALPGLLRAREAAAAGRMVLMVAVELCSLHLQLEPTMENVVSTSLFADGAAAALVTNSAGASTGPRLLDSATYCDYQGFEDMAFHLTDHGFRMKLSAYVPDLLAADIESFVDDLLERNNLHQDDIRFWAVHPGSSKIIDYTGERLGLAEADLAYSRDVLRRYGNMSSPTVLFVLNEILCSGLPEPGDRGMLMAFGPGLTMEASLLEW